MFCFIVGPPLDVRFEMDLENDMTVWRNYIDSVNTSELIAGF
jgi:hypothetical protein